MITDVTKPGKLSAEYAVKISFAMAREAEPEIGRKIKSGKTSAGIPTGDSTGESRRTKNSTAPLAQNIRTPTISAISEGKRFRETESPFFTPSTKLS